MKRFLGALGFLMAAAGAACAGVVTCSDAETFSGADGVSTNGTLAYAYFLDSVADVEVNGVAFSSVSEGAAGVFGHFASSLDLSQNNIAFTSGTSPWAGLATEPIFSGSWWLSPLNRSSETQRVTAGAGVL